MKKDDAQMKAMRPAQSENKYKCKMENAKKIKKWKQRKMKWKTLKEYTSVINIELLERKIEERKLKTEKEPIRVYRLFEMLYILETKRCLRETSS